MARHSARSQTISELSGADRSLRGTRSRQTAIRASSASRRIAKAINKEHNSRLPAGDAIPGKIGTECQRATVAHLQSVTLGQSDPPRSIVKRLTPKPRSWVRRVGGIRQRHREVGRRYIGRNERRARHQILRAHRRWIRARRADTLLKLAPRGGRWKKDSILREHPRELLRSDAVRANSTRTIVRALVEKALAERACNREDGEALEEEERKDGEDPQRTHEGSLCRLLLLEREEDGGVVPRGRRLDGHALFLLILL
eukprot:scaffold102590_cov31-Tisochrysis_lutea.AAC.1